VQCSRRRDGGVLPFWICADLGRGCHCTAGCPSGDAMQVRGRTGPEVHTRVLPSPVVEWRTLCLFDGVGRLYSIYNFENM
jgi:hypothetical protein